MVLDDDFTVDHRVPFAARDAAQAPFIFAGTRFHFLRCFEGFN